jgi:hypothetical protein
MMQNIIHAMERMVVIKVVTKSTDQARFVMLISEAMLSPRDGMTLRAHRTAAYPSKEGSLKANGSRVPKSPLVLKY